MTRFAFVGLCLLVASCGGSSFTSLEGTAPPDDAGSPAGSGGSNTGSGGSGGGASTGGAPGTGGAMDTGGATGSGGAIGTGGAVGTGGAAGAGGRPGTGGNGGSTVDGGTHPTPDGGTGPACKVDSDCKLVDSCCVCAAVPPNTSIPVCNIACIQSACAAMQIHGVRCSQGSCVAAPDCDGSKVTCKILPPVCPLGQVLSVKGACWGPCVPATSCLTVTDCKSCASDGHFCARQEALPGATFRCVDTPAACDANITCGCAGSFACLPPFSSCNASMDGRQLNCSCPTC
jgi:hypothetical protein